MNQASSSQRPDSASWAVVLAAGEGKRLASVTRFLYGREVPKQFAALDGDRTLLQHTLDRLAPLVPPERTVVVIAADRLQLAQAQLAPYPGVQIVCQPENVGTGPGVLLPLFVVKAQDPTATVIVTPSDHHIPRQQAFLKAAEQAIDATYRDVPSGLVLLGAEAEAPVSDLGWIVPAAPQRTDEGGTEVAMVESFVEKPPLAVAEQLLSRGGLWNTLVIVGAVEAFWRQAERHMPRQTSLFRHYESFLLQNGNGARQDAEQMLGRLYQSMAYADFSRTVLQNAAGLGVVPLRGSGWCDCGTPERLLTCLGEKTADTHPQLLRAILRSIQAERGLQSLPGG